MGLALDEPKDTDEIFERDTITFMVDKGLLAQAQSIKVDYVTMGTRSGFSITSGLKSDCCGTCSC